MTGAAAVKSLFAPAASRRPISPQDLTMADGSDPLAGDDLASDARDPSKSRHQASANYTVESFSARIAFSFRMRSCTSGLNPASRKSLIHRSG